MVRLCAAARTLPIFLYFTSMTLYRDVLRRAWVLTWRNKLLWLFGFLATFWSVGGVFEIARTSLSSSTSRSFFLVQLWRDIATTGLGFGGFFQGIVADPLVSFLLLVVFVVTLAVVAFLVWLTTSSQIAVVAQVSGLEHEMARSPFAAFGAARRRFWQVFWINILSRGIAMVAAIILSWAIAMVIASTQGVSWLGFLGYLILFAIAMAVIVIASFVAMYAVIYTVIHEYPFRRALLAGWNLFVTHWLVSLETAVILFAITGLTAIGLFLFGLMLMGPLYLITFVSLILAARWIYILGFALVIVAIVVVTFLAVAALTTFQLATWVELVTRLEEGTVASKLHRLADRHLGIAE